ncbi:EAL domain-containing protein [Paucibacter sp. O1-1]|nr:EAL domain-containing protein [Paucibacter sp. O1-1]MDA3831265.1 EAL domain-containing protein [Paucibacter sp. O1-1]
MKLTLRWSDVLERRREAVVALSALLVFALVLSVLQYARLRDRHHSNMLTQINIVAQTVSAAMVFDSRDDAGDLLGALEQSPAILHARLVHSDGRVFTVYSRLLPVTTLWHRWAGVEMFTVPVMVDGRRIGELIVDASLLPMWSDMAGFVAAALGLLLASAALAWLLSKRMRAQMHEAESRTRYLARFDALTNLPNREHLRGLLDRALQQGDGATLLILDLDDFKQINDQHGHGAGDSVLQATALRLQKLCRPGSHIARLSSDEFAMLVVPQVDADMLRSLVAQLQAALTQPLLHDGSWLRLHVSIGAALLPEHADNAGAAMGCADAAMRHAKQLGRDSFQLFTPQMGEALQRRLALEEDLQQALQKGQLSLAYQPQYDAQRRIQGFEALARWHHPERGWVSPAEFIPVAESSGLIVELGLSMLAVLRGDLDAWRAQGLSCPPVAINLSWEQCRKPQHRDRLLQTLQQLQLGPDEVEFELTESADFEDIDTPDSFVFTLQGLGYSLAIDDFGTGYSSLAYLRRMRCRKLKIDRLFVHGMSAHPDARMLVESMIRVAQAMRMVVVAEGVELPADEAALVTMGCDLMQGFGFSKPVQAEDVVPLLHASREVTENPVAPH